MPPMSGAGAAGAGGSGRSATRLSVVRTIAATLANNFAEADGMMRAALFGMGLLLLLLSLAVQIGAQYYLVALGRKMGKR